MPSCHFLVTILSLYVVPNRHFYVAIKLSFPNCHFFVVTNLPLPNCHLYVLTKLLLPNYRYQTVTYQVGITKLSLTNCPYQIDVTKHPDP